MKASGGRIAALVLTLLLAPGLLWFAWFARDSLAESGLEFFLNRSSGELFGSSLDFDGVRVDDGLGIRIQRITGKYLGFEKPFPFEILDIRSADPLTHFLTAKPFRLTFGSFRPLGSSQEGVAGRLVLIPGSAGGIRLEADVVALHLEEIEALEPGTLKRAEGRLTGRLLLTILDGKAESFELALSVKKPGGRIQARFFDLLVPYIPGVEKEVLRRLAAESGATVAYREADLSMTRPEPEAVLLRLHILVPEYNLNLNLNLTLRVEEEAVFSELARLAGLVQGESA